MVSWKQKYKMLHGEFLILRAEYERQTGKLWYGYPYDVKDIELNVEDAVAQLLKKMEK